MLLQLEKPIIMASPTQALPRSRLRSLHLLVSTSPLILIHPITDRGIELVRTSHDFTDNLHKDAQDALLARASRQDNSPSIKKNSREGLLLRRMDRYNEIAEEGLMILCILSYSPTFRRFCGKETNDNWQAIRHEILENFESIEYFAKVRDLPWANLLELDDNFRTHIQTDRKGWLMERLGRVRVQHPHAMIVPDGRGRLRLPTFEGLAQTMISKNIYRHDLFSDPRFERPTNWPDVWDYPSDPSTRLEGKTCISCKSLTLCDCDARNCGIIQEPLLELRHYSKYGARGTGIRTLQKIKKGTYLGQYLGEIVPTQSAYPLLPSGGRAFEGLESVYTFELLNEMGQISAGTFGCWTRFVNHSCEPSVGVVFEDLGTKLRILFKTLEDIEPFEELTIHYGNEYFSQRRPCLCGAESCGGDFDEARARKSGRPSKRVRRA